MAVNFQELEAWFRERPKWLQDAARRLVQNGELTEQDFRDLFAICIAEGAGQTVAFAGLEAGSLVVQDTTKPLRLDSVSDVKGINALAPTKPLNFGAAPLCIAYGRNGAGKSGYVRLLKHACGARRPGELLANIFAPCAQPQSANIAYSYDNQKKAATWSGQPVTELCGVDIYDTACGLVYVNDENEVAFEPWLLRLFTKLTATCENLSKRIDGYIQLRVSNKPPFPSALAATASGQWYSSLSAGTTTTEMNQKSAWAVEDETVLNSLNRRLAEANPAARAAVLWRQKASVADLATSLRAMFYGLSAEKCGEYLRAKAVAKAKRLAADEDAKTVFEKAPLDGVGSESWRLLWEAARKYSTDVAYHTAPYPNVAVDARCVLCQRELDAESRERFQSFENFVKGELQRHATQAIETLQALENALPQIPHVQALALQMDAVGVTGAEDRRTIEDFVAALSKRKTTCLSAQDAANLPVLPSATMWQRLDALAGELEKQAAACDEDAKGANRPQLEAQQRELSARKWLNQQRQAIDGEISRLNQLQTLLKAQNLTSTQALSRKKSALADEMITTAYINRFKNELAKLMAAHLLVEIKKTKTEIGRVFHRITLHNVIRDVRTSDILSEGEFRIVSLAAFLADTEGRGAKTAFIFDDPISSLDHVFEEAAAQRLVALCKHRQVIIFTHRLSLVGMLEKYSGKEHVATSLVCLSRIRTGDIAGLPINLEKTKPAANRLLNEGIAEAKKARNIGDEQYELVAKGLCRDIRILMEQIVESDLLDGIVRRYSPEVQTKGKIEHLAKITTEDCKFVDDMITAYSRYEHSQPDEAPVPLPQLDQLEGDLKRITAFVNEIQNRKKAQ